MYTQSNNMLKGSTWWICCRGQRRSPDCPLPDKRLPYAPSPLRNGSNAMGWCLHLSRCYSPFCWGPELARPPVEWCRCSPARPLAFSVKHQRCRTFVPEDITSLGYTQHKLCSLPSLVEPEHPAPMALILITTESLCFCRWWLKRVGVLSTCSRTQKDSNKGLWSCYHCWHDSLLDFRTKICEYWWRAKLGWPE